MQLPQLLDKTIAAGVRFDFWIFDPSPSTLPPMKNPEHAKNSILRYAYMWAISQWFKWPRPEVLIVLYKCHYCHGVMMVVADP